MESSSEIKITVYGKTDVGLMREHNEDNFLVVDFASGKSPSPESPLDFSLGEKGALFLVCDGMGGAAAGEVASTMAVESISLAVGTGEPPSRERFARRLRRAIEEANEASSPKHATTRTSAVWVRPAPRWGWSTPPC
jgi:serine/threonine protein phosphatase PrpC